MSHAEHVKHYKIMCHGSENFLDFKLLPVIIFHGSEPQDFYLGAFAFILCLFLLHKL